MHQYENSKTVDAPKRGIVDYIKKQKKIIYSDQK